MRNISVPTVEPRHNYYSQQVIITQFGEILKASQRRWEIKIMLVPFAIWCMNKIGT